jgi:hypothetical protein
LSGIIPLTILLIVYDAAPDSVEILIADLKSCPEYGQCQRLRRAGMIVDFRRICGFGSGILSLSDRLFSKTNHSKQQGQRRRVNATHVDSIHGPTHRSPGSRTSRSIPGHKSDDVIFVIPVCR